MGRFYKLTRKTHKRVLGADEEGVVRYQVFTAGDVFEPTEAELQAFGDRLEPVIEVAAAPETPAPTPSPVVVPPPPAAPKPDKVRSDSALAPSEQERPEPKPAPPVPEPKAQEPKVPSAPAPKPKKKIPDKRLAALPIAEVHRLVKANEVTAEDAYRVELTNQRRITLLDWLRKRGAGA